jgi:hypothetical protein
MMKLLTILTLSLTLLLPATVFAGKGNKGAGGKAGKKEVYAALKAADTNGNNQIDADEVAGLTDTINKAPADSPLKQLDKNGDGKLDADEVKAINDMMAAKAAKGGKKKAK